METVKFEELQLDDRILRAVTDMGFEEASPIQAKAIPVELEGCDIIGQAQTGTGKTAAFGIPLLEKVDPENRKVQALVLCPTRELAIQVSEEIRNLAKSNPSALNVEELLYAATLFDNNGDKLAIYEAAMRQFPNDWRGFNDAGMILFETGKVAQAKADFEKANALSANNKTIKNNLGAVELINGNVKEAEVLFGAATGAGNEVNYNKGIVAIMKGDYKAAVDYFGKCNCVNAALANILAGNNNEAAKKLNEGKDDSALASYLKAVIAARNNDNSAVLSNLKTACSKDASMKKLAATDMEFAKLFDNADFQAIVK